VSVQVPLVDLRAQHEEVRTEVRAGWDQVTNDCHFILGSSVEGFETAFAAFSEVGHCVGVANGTDAIELALRAAGVGPGDEVLVPVNTFIASAVAVVRAGARPVLVDVDPDALLMDPKQADSRIGPRTRAILPVHLYGQIAPMGALRELASSHGLAIVEDAAQAHGARQAGVGAGGFGALTATSFYPGKNLGAFGDAGAVLTDSADLAGAVRALRNYGGEAKYDHPSIGFNSRLDALQAVVLSAKLKHLARWNDGRRAAALRYDELLADVAQVRCPRALPGNEHVWHLYVVRVPERDRVLAELHAAGIGAGIHYPNPLHLEGAFQRFGYRRGDFPVAEGNSLEILSLPIYPHITAEQQAYVVDHLKKAVA